MKKTLADFIKMKEEGKKVVFLTAYSSWQAQLAEQAGVDMLLVGDSGGMTEMGYKNTLPVTMEDMMHMIRSVLRGAPNTFVVGDMPFLSYQTSDEEAVRNAGRFIQAGCDAVKLEGGERMASRVKAITAAGICTMGHIGLTPQSLTQQGYKVQGKSEAAVEQLRKDAQALESAGASFILLEAMPPEVVSTMRKGNPYPAMPELAHPDNITIPLYGIGAGPHTDGQLLIFHDVVGLFQAFTPKFAKRYAEAGQLIKNALTEYCMDVRQEKFPSQEYWYKA